MMSIIDEAFAFTVGEEGGFQCDPDDSGNWTGGKVGAGELRGTKYGVSAAAYPMLDIKNLSLEDAKLIFEKDYWKKAGCDKLTAPLDIIVCDNAYHSGVSAALENLRQYPDWKDLIVERMEDMCDAVDKRSTSLKYLKGWIRRAIKLYRKILEAQPVQHPITEEYRR